MEGPAPGKTAPGQAAVPSQPVVPGPAAVPAARPPKSEQTRGKILQAALDLFEERGYERTTMRAIAQAANVSVGNAYYYFASKEHLVQGLYDRIAQEHAEAVEAILDGDRDFASRFRKALLAWLDVAQPYHQFAAHFFKNAADPDSPLSPFSAGSQPARDAAIGLHRKVVEGSDLKADPELLAMLPELLWFHQMGVVLYWVYDRSPGARRSRRLVERSAPMVARLVSLSRHRLIRPLIGDAKDLIREFLIPPERAGSAPS